MAKFYGKVGYAESAEISPGIWSGTTEKEYYGDVLNNSYRWQANSEANDDISLSSRISILADPYAFEHFQFIRYVEWMGAKWKVTSIEPAYPRIILTIGGVYNAE